MSRPGALAGGAHRDIWRISAPLVLSNVSIATLGLVDTAVVGHLDHAHYLGAVAIATVVFDLLYWGMGFLRMGTTGLAAQAAGGGEGDALRCTLGQALALAAAIAAVLLACRGPLIELGLALLHGSDAVDLHARRYFAVAIWGAPAVLCLQVCMGWLIGVQAPRAALLVAVAYNLLNVVLDLVFVLHLGMDVDGVALAAVLAQYFGLALALALVGRRLRGHAGAWRREQLLDPARLRRLLHLNLNIMLRTWCLILTFAFFTDRSAAQGEIVLAANSILQKFQMLMALALDGFAHAAEALVGRALGAGEAGRFRRVVADCAAWSAALALAFSLAYALGGAALAALMTDLAAVHETVLIYLPWMVLSPLVSVWPFLFDGVFIGATRAREMRNTMAFASLLVFLPAWWLLRPWGNHGLWAAFMIFMAARGAAMALVYRQVAREILAPAVRA